MGSSFTDRVLGSRPSVSVFTTLTGHQLRVLAYHDAPDFAAFRVQMEWLSLRCTPVTLRDVIASISGSSKLPRRAVWVTFDDGHPRVIERAQPSLDHFGVKATLFVCPGVIVSRQPYWWEVVEQGLSAGLQPTMGRGLWTTPALVAYLKTVPDPLRREVVAGLADALAARTGRPPEGKQLSDGQLKPWRAAGHTLGNHTWDHPCLDQCSAGEQYKQIARADDWLARFTLGQPRVFAYPNGDWTADAEAALTALGYDAAVLFDHRLVKRRTQKLHLSRLRITSDATLPRLRAVVSGANPSLFGLRRSRTKPGLATA